MTFLESHGRGEVEGQPPASPELPRSASTSKKIDLPPAQDTLSPGSSSFSKLNAPESQQVRGQASGAALELVCSVPRWLEEATQDILASTSTDVARTKPSFALAVDQIDQLTFEADKSRIQALIQLRAQTSFKVAQVAIRDAIKGSYLVPETSEERRRTVGALAYEMHRNYVRVLGLLATENSRSRQDQFNLNFGHYLRERESALVRSCAQRHYARLCLDDPKWHSEALDQALREGLRVPCRGVQYDDLVEYRPSADLAQYLKSNMARKSNLHGIVGDWIGSTLTTKITGSFSTALRLAHILGEADKHLPSIGRLVWEFPSLYAMGALAEFYSSPPFPLANSVKHYTQRHILGGLRGLPAVFSDEIQAAAKALMDPQPAQSRDWRSRLRRVFSWNGVPLAI